MISLSFSFSTLHSLSIIIFDLTTLLLNKFELLILHYSSICQIQTTKVVIFIVVHQYQPQKQKYNYFHEQLEVITKLVSLYEDDLSHLQINLYHFDHIKDYAIFFYLSISLSTISLHSHSLQTSFGKANSSTLTLPQLTQMNFYALFKKIDFL